MPTHLKRICSAIDQMPPNMDVDISQPELDFCQQSNTESARHPCPSYLAHLRDGASQRSFMPPSENSSPETTAQTRTVALSIKGEVGAVFKIHLLSHCHTLSQRGVERNNANLKMKMTFARGSTAPKALSPACAASLLIEFDPLSTEVLGHAKN
ncbi:hypothetical protein I7I53_09212 [Histoplasma capsulatum var. duboisii H88]|uniref:Uncharacterized protein n=1 Tax=Ajellomyces capsulatus (strain H88) TaxID=544711 RepID=A0A8A1L4V6_AJEC8|nr:hypothetical protein I7I53_09212 [Histoplasma capsulatum var. duboisii H88]